MGAGKGRKGFGGVGALEYGGWVGVWGFGAFGYAQVFGLRG